jgi:gluconolactonase
VITDMACPNGLAFSPDESRLYVADTGRMFTALTRSSIRVYDMVKGRPVNGRHFHTITPGCADGIRVDTTATCGPRPLTGCIASPRTGI